MMRNERWSLKAGVKEGEEEERKKKTGVLTGQGERGS